LLYIGGGHLLQLQLVTATAFLSYFLKRVEGDAIMVVTEKTNYGVSATPDMGELKDIKCLMKMVIYMARATIDLCDTMLRADARRNQEAVV
jgi:hypothetical protein